jgi:hypothetical protein
VAARNGPHYVILQDERLKLYHTYLPCNSLYAVFKCLQISFDFEVTHQGITDNALLVPWSRSDDNVLTTAIC